ncbi:HAD family hydrolase [Enemella dayhoffiae]|uniref:HAD family hydrolase n=1 Tax=Enemella dayhoffiae TaxID=2016507 RepID=A0A255HAZ9_9ACTN|nr:HAD family hydrolase [Enemella dayhoffiae]OYO24988.1 HAD family hydrolase [Enemella dayhoffiae]
MSWQPRLVALDIDGTVVDHAGVLPDSVREAVQRVLAAGVPVVLSTGRSWHATRPVFDALGLPPGYAVSSNGAVVVHYPPVEVIRQVTFDPADVVSKVCRLAPEALIATEVVGQGYRASGAFPVGDLDGEVIIETPEQLGAEPVTRVIVRDPGRSDQDFLDLAEQLGLHGVSYFIGYSAWLDIAPEGVHKATGLAEVCSRLGVDRADVLAMGDGRNDIEMLRWAGRGVALGDAPPEVQRAADAVTGLFADDGTPAELARWF